MSKRPRQPVAQPPAPEKDAGGLVITPAGPVRSDRVRVIEPGQTVVRRKDGSYRVVPRPGAK